MNISVIGTGYVGLVTGACFADVGNDVACVDVDEEKIEGLKNGIIPFYEPGLKDIVLDNQEKGRLKFTTKISEVLTDSEICFIAVGTPMGGDGAADLRYVKQVAEEIGEYMQNDLIIVDKSTVPVGTGKKVADVISQKLKERGVDYKYSIVSNPEFLKEGTAVADCMSPDRVVIGSDDSGAVDKMRLLYSPIVHSSDRVIVMDVESAEMTKYVANAMLATRISFMNEMAGICEKVGADVTKVRLGVGSDSRIGYPFLYAGCGYGGSCFPKDVQALMKTAYEVGIKPSILEGVEQVNYDQKRVLAQKVVKHYGEDLTGLTFGVWGLAFKPNTDDMREAPAMVLIEELAKRGATIKAYDPIAMEVAKKHYIKPEHNTTLVYSRSDAYKGVDALILVTEWKEFRSLNFEKMKELMNNPVIFDGRNIFPSKEVRKNGFTLYQIGIVD